MATVFKLDSTDFNNTIEQYISLSRKELLTEVNRRAANICARAVNLTPRANIDKIVRDMKAVEVVKASYIKTTKKGEKVALGKGGKTTQGKRTVSYMGKAEAFAIANWRLARGKRLGFYRKFPNSFAGPGRGKSGGTASQFYDRFVTTHRSSSGYIAAGWLKAFNTLREMVKGVKTLQPDKNVANYFKTLKGSAGRGFAKPATMIGDVFKAVFANAARGIDRVGRMPLRVAMRLEENDMKDYIARKNQQLLNTLARS